MESLRQRKLSVRLLFGLATVAALVTLYFFDPAQYSFYPRCVFHSLTGWNCPGCGSTRALYQLLHGNFVRAFQLNPVFVLMLPLLGIFVLRRVQTNNAQRHSPTQGDYV